MAELAIPYLQRRGWAPPEPAPEIRQWLADVVEAVANYLDKLEDVAVEAELIFEFDPARSLSAPEVQEIVTADGALDVIRQLHHQVEKYEFFGPDEYKQAAAEVKKATGRKGKELFHPIRVILTGRPEGPELDLAVPAIDRGAELPDDSRLPSISGCRERARAFLGAMGQQ